MKKWYEVLGYKTKEDYLNYNFEVIVRGVSKKEAAYTALFFIKDYEVIKVQSWDREDIVTIREQE